MLCTFAFAPVSRKQVPAVFHKYTRLSQSVCYMSAVLQSCSPTATMTRHSTTSRTPGAVQHMTVHFNANNLIVIHMNVLGSFQAL